MGTNGQVWQGEVEVEALEHLTPEYFRLSFRQRAIAEAARPGQFLNVLVPAPNLCLRRPISFYGTAGDQVTVLVGIHGRGTEALGRLRVGDRLDVMGPLGGRGLSLAPGARRVALVGGGVGLPPLRFLAEVEAGRAEFVAFVGARTAARLLCLDELRELGVEVRPSTDDGSVGFAGTAVAALEAALAEAPVDQILCCGPTPMMAAAAAVAAAHDLPCQVCLEARMACALGACLSCVIETTAEGWTKYQRVCTEGPVFDARNVVWDALSPLCAL